MSFNKFLNEMDTDLNALHDNICDIRNTITTMRDQLTRFADYIRSIPLEDKKLEKDRQM